MFTLLRGKLHLQLTIVICATMLMGCSMIRKDVINPQRILVLQNEVMATLTGEAQLSGGGLMPDRCTLENRQACRNYLMELFQELGLEGVRHPYSEDGENVYAVLPATVQSDEYVVIGAHYDTTRPDHPGANDDATGCVVVAAAAQALPKLKHRSRNFIFIFFDQEESGMRGSRAFAQKLKDENMNVHSVHTTDQLGWDEDGDRAFELEIPYEGAVELYEEARQLLGLELTIHVTPEAGSDHSSFRRQGFPAVGITEEYRNGDTTPHYHKATDTYATINFDYMAETTQLLIKAWALLAQ